MPAILDLLRGRVKERELHALDHVAEAARAAAAGKTYDVAALEAALEAQEMTVADFEEAVDLAKRRATWLSRFDGLTAATARAKKLEAAIEAEEKRFEEQRVALIARCDKIRGELEVVTKNRDSGTAAKAELLDPSNVPGSVGIRYRDACRELQEAEVAVEVAARKVKEQADRIRHEEGWLAQLGHEQARQLQPDRKISIGGRQDPEETAEVRDHRTALARAQRRKSEADSELAAAEKIAATARRVVADLVPKVLQA